MMRSVFLTAVILALFATTGCSPDVASVDSTPSPVGSAATSPQQAQPNPPAAPEANQDPIEKKMSKMNPEEINQALEGMEPGKRTEVVLRFLSFSLLFFYSVYNRYPSAEEGLDILLAPPVAPNGKHYEQFARDVLLLDGWQRKIQYQPVPFPSGLPGFKLKSLGPDGVESEDDVTPDVENLSVEVTSTIAAGGLGDIK